MTKRAFLDNLRLARNLLVHGDVTSDSQQLDATAQRQALKRAAIWLTPSSVQGFQALDFAELGSGQQRRLAEAVQEFERVAMQVPPDQPATDEQFRDAREALLKVATILRDYLPSHEEDKQVEEVLATLDFPSWVLNWDYEFGSDADGVAAVWVTLYADDSEASASDFGRYVIQLIPRLRSRLKAAGIGRWPYVRVRAAREYKALQG